MKPIWMSHGRWENVMQNLTQIIMQKWGHTAARQATGRDAMLLATSVMMAMLLVGCSGGNSET